MISSIATYKDPTNLLTQRKQARRKDAEENSKMHLREGLIL